jgi:hypothetical protein
MTGAPCRGGRVEKYNQLMRIEEALGGSAVFERTIFPFRELTPSRSASRRKAAPIR